MTQAVTLAGLASTNTLYADSSGNVGIGTSSPAVKLNVIGTGLFGTNGGNSTYFNPFTATTSSVQAHSSGANSGSVVATEYSASGGAGPGFYAGRSASGTLGTQTACTSGMQLGSFGAYGSDGTNFLQCAYITAFAQSSFATNNGATYLSFGTNGGSASVTERMRLDASGNVGIGTTASLSRLTALGTTSTVSNGASTRNPIASIRGGNDNNRLDFYVDNSGATAIMGLGAYNTAGAGTAMAFYTGASASESMRINSSGYITKPYQPMASVNYTGASTGAFNPILYNNVLLNDGNCYNSSTGRFTCPVAGRYRVQANDMSAFQAATGCYLIVNKNGSAVSGIGYSRADGVAHNHASITAIIQCAVGDYLTLQQATSSYGNGYNHATFEFIG